MFIYIPPKDRRYYDRREGTLCLIKVDRTVKRETIYIGAFVLILSALLEAVFLIIGRWDYKVLCGNLLGGGIATLNFFLLGITVQKALTREADKASDLMKFSKRLRMLLLFAVAIIGVILPVFNTIAVLLPLFFPRIAIMFRPFFGKDEEQSGADEGK